MLFEVLRNALRGRNWIRLSETREKPPQDAGVTACVPMPTGCCKKCDSSAVAVLHGRYGYYLKCRDCQTNTSLTVPCAACGGKRRISKRGNDYFAVCGKTGDKTEVQVGRAAGQH